ncbi:Alanine--glyoxylate aminotransferase 1 [Nakaseomyces bracarensis]|uniref:alanine--glyoxylate transaminase n=1 Tax=Nakaseomyces bracarensis TaxID=273131 RepID=A0ABR4NPH3_9SACH
MNTFKGLTRLITPQLKRNMSNQVDTLLIPGPVILSDSVQRALDVPSLSHTSPEFGTILQRTLKNTRKLFRADEKKGQAFVIAGSGTLGWDIVGANLINQGDNALVVSTGVFSDFFAECLEAYGANVDKLTAETGESVPLESIRSQLSKKNYKVVTLTHVDTSTAVLTDVKAAADLIHKESPDSYIVVDGVCSIGCEEFEFDKWNIDYCLTASQKAIGAPAGLSISMASQRVIDFVKSDQYKMKSFFTSLKKWTPIMEGYEAGTPKYFATPAIQAINSLDVAIQEILADGLEARWEKHAEISKWFKDKVTNELGLKLVTKYPSECAAHGLTAIYVDEPGKVIGALKANGVVIAGGILPSISTKYIRVGHMGVTACDPSVEYIPTCYKLLKEHT